MNRSNQAPDGFVFIRGNLYETVAARLARFRDLYPDWSMLSEIVHVDERSVLVRATIVDQEGRERSRGHAEEIRASSNINKTSAVENAETSAWGRALAPLLPDVDAVASADEVHRAIEQQDAPENINEAQAIALLKLMDEVDADAAGFCKFFAIDSVKKLPVHDFDRARALLEKKRKTQ